MAADPPWWSRADASAKTVTEVHDAEIDALPEEGRQGLARVWQNRGGLELQVGAGFAVILRELVEHGAIRPVMEIVARAVRDEVRHAEISVDLAARYRGDATIFPEPAPVNIPELAPATGPLRTSLHVIAMCCINETFACSVLEASLSRTRSPLVRAALQSILSDEIDHARAGWAHLASSFVSQEVRRSLGPWVKRLLAGKLTGLLEDAAPMPGQAYPSHGMLTRDDFRAVARATLDDVFFPGLEAAGVDCAPSRAWAAQALTALPSTPTP